MNPPKMERPPTSIGMFAIEAELGRGGMGVVYRARDPVLARNVAIKVIQTDVASLSGRQKRFEREAQILASLNHPNVASIYSLEVRGATVFLVLELVEGTTLGERVREGPLSIEETISVCSQVAAAIRAAHTAHVIHGDLKPENVMITPAGVVKVLDFGLAEMAADQSARVRPKSLKAITDRLLVMAGTGRARARARVQGTPRYLSPEQIRGKGLSEATDIWQLGCIMYECLCGQVAFKGVRLKEVISAILKDAPDWTRMPTDVPPQLVTLIQQCLSKRAEDRPSDVRQIEVCLASLSRDVERIRDEIPGNLPREATSFVGRADELGRMSELLGGRSLVTIIGAGGTGKTRLSIAAARLHERAYRGGTWLIELASLSDPGSVVQQIALTFGLKQRAGHTLRDSVIDFFQERHAEPTLMLLDNCEHLLRPCAEACEFLLANCPNVKILASSREALGVPGESVLNLPSLPTLDPARGLPRVAAMEKCESIFLFLERARRVRAGFTLTEDNKQAIAEICHRLDGIPLALELAAARLRMLSVEQIADKLGHRFLLLTGGSRTALPRQQTLRALIDWSYDLLTGEEKALVRSLSVFRGGWTLAAASRIHHDGGESNVLEVLNRLVDKSLVLVDRSKPDFRYSFLETLRQYCRDRMIESGGAIELRRRHLQFFREFLEHAAARSRGEDAKASFDDIEGEHDNLREALDWCQSSEEFHELGIQMACDMSRFWELRGYVAEGRERLRSALEAARAVPVTVKARAMEFMAGLLRELGQYPRSMELFAEVLATFQAAGDVEGEANAKLHMSSILWRTGKLGDAERVLMEILPHYEAAGDSQVLSAVWRSLSVIALKRGNIVEANRLAERAILMTRRSADANALGLALQLGGVLKRKLGDIPASYRMHEEALSLMIDLGSRPAIAMQLINLGNLASLEGDWGLARQFLGTALQNARDLGRKGTVAEALGALSDVYSSTGEVEPALEAISECLVLCNESGDRQGQARALDRIASLSLGRRPLSEIVEMYLRSLELFEAAESRLDLVMTLENCSEFALALARPAEAAQILAAADSMCRTYGIQRAAEAALTPRRTQRVLDALGDSGFNASWERGRGLTLLETRSLIGSLAGRPPVSVVTHAPGNATREGGPSRERWTA